MKPISEVTNEDCTKMKRRLKMEYKIKDGRNVCDNGEVIINHVRHRVINGWVKCDDSLNRFSWDTTDETSICHKCYNQPTQLNLFE